MTTPTVPLVDGAYYWVKLKPRPHHPQDGEWKMARWRRIVRSMRVVNGFDYDREDLDAISGPIPTPDGEGE